MVKDEFSAYHFVILCKSLCKNLKSRINTKGVMTRLVTAKPSRVCLRDISNNNINKNKQRLSPLLIFYLHLFLCYYLFLPRFFVAVRAFHISSSTHMHCTVDFFKGGNVSVLAMLTLIVACNLFYL